MTILEIMRADAKAAQARQKAIWKIGAEYDDGTTVSMYEITRPRPSSVTTHTLVAGFDLTYNPDLKILR